MKINSDYPINKIVEIEFSEILKDYNILVTKKIKKEYNKEFLVDSDPNTCRFCGKSYPEVKFENEAHTIPEFMGNKNLFSKFECDTCNNSYFSLFENEMANYMLSHNTMSGTKSKNNKIPKYKLKGQPQIINGPEKILISKVPDSALKEASDGSLSIEIKIPSYIPEFIYRCLVKIGISLVPEKNIAVSKDTISWLMNLEIEQNLKPFMLFSMYPFDLQTSEIICTILELKDECTKNFPHSIFFLSYNNFAFQIHIPYSLKEKIGMNLNVIPFAFPMTLDLSKNFEGMRTNNIIDLSSKERIRNEIVTYTIIGDRN
ncbi:MAG: HNH endonuclease [Bacteroidales bacterium]|jgi:hypothetical protein